MDIGNEEIAPEVQEKRLGIFLDAYGDMDSQDPVAAVLDAQAALAARPDTPGPVQRWAAQCRDWTTTHRSAIEMALEEADDR